MVKKFSSNELYDAKTLYTLSGASMAVWLFTTVFSNIFNVEIANIRWVGLIVALFLAYLGAFNLKEKMNINIGTVAFFNGLLIFVTASGIDSINHGMQIDKESKNIEKMALIPFTSKNIWWKPSEMEDSILSLQAIIKLKEEKLISYQNRIDLLLAELNEVNANLNRLESQKKADIESSEKKTVRREKKIPSKISSVSLNNQKIAPEKVENIHKITIFEYQNLYGLILSDDTIITPEYTAIHEFTEDSLIYFSISKDNLWGILDKDGKERIPLKHKTEDGAKTALVFSEMFKGSGSVKKIGL